VNAQLYPTDLTDSQWGIIQELIPPAKPGGRPRSLDMRLVVNAVLYVAVGGIQWRMLPKEYPKWQSVYSYFRDWKHAGVWQRIHDTLRARVRSVPVGISTRPAVVWTARVSKPRRCRAAGALTRPN
jgi:putative transposase